MKTAEEYLEDRWPSIRYNKKSISHFAQCYARQVSEQQSKEIERLKARKIAYQKGDNEHLDQLIERRSEALFENPYSWEICFKSAYRDAAKYLGVDNLLDQLNEKDQLLKEMADNLNEAILSIENAAQPGFKISGNHKWKQTLSKYKEMVKPEISVT